MSASVPHATCHSHSSPSVLSISTSAAALLFDNKPTSIAAAAANVAELPHAPSPPSSSAEAAIIESSAPSSRSLANHDSSKAHGLQTRHAAHADDIVCLMTAIASSCSDNRVSCDVSGGVGGTVSCLAALLRLITALPPPPSAFPHASSLVQCLFCHAISQVLGLSSPATSTNFSEPLFPNAQHARHSPLFCSRWSLYRRLSRPPLPLGPI